MYDDASFRYYFEERNVDTLKYWFDVSQSVSAAKLVFVYILCACLTLETISLKKLFFT